MKRSTLTASLFAVTCIILSAGVATAQTDTEIKSLNVGVRVSTKHGQVITTAINSYMSRSNVNDFQIMQPFNLVYQAYQGNLKLQGIPSGSTLIFQHQRGNINAKDLVKAAVNAKKLPDQMLQDESYLSAVDVQLKSLPTTFLH